MAEQPLPDNDDEPRAPETVGSGNPGAADRQGDIAADDAGATALGEQLGVQGEETKP